MLVVETINSHTRLLTEASTEMSPTPLLLLLLLCGTCYCCCPESWVQFGSSCYFYNQQPLPWVLAHEVCKLLDSHLVEITSASENSFVMNLISSKQAVFAWTGINDMVTDGKWVLTSTRQPLVYTNWYGGEPNNYQGVREDCGGMYTSGFWNDAPCDPAKLFPSVCQKPA